MNLIPFPTKPDPLILRAGAHAVREDLLPTESRLRDGVTDLDMARLLRGLESGTEVWLEGYRWQCPPRSPLRAKLAGTVNEAIRVGLVHQVADRTGPHTVRQLLVAAPVHLRSADNPDRPACHQPITYKRYRLMNAEDVQYVDCQACLSSGMIEL